MPPLDISKVVMTFCEPNLGSWMRTIRNIHGVTIIGPISLFISFQWSRHDKALGDPLKPLRYANIANYAKEVIATLVYEKIIANSQQIVEIGIEKKEGPKTEVMILIQQ